jgi:hypothetical protein
MDKENRNKQLITFSAITLLFLGSLSYFVSVAIRSRDGMQAKEDATQELIDTL